jgi:hypothetical protein
VLLTCAHNDYNYAGPHGSGNRKYALKIHAMLVYLLLLEQWIARAMPLESGGHMWAPRYSHTWVSLVVWMCSSAFLLNTGLGGAAETITLTAPKEPARADDSFVRLFPGLPPFAPPN